MASKTVILRRPKKATLSWSGTVNVTMTDMENAAEAINNSKLEVVNKIQGLEVSSKLADPFLTPGLDVQSGALPLGTKITKKGTVVFLSEIQREETLQKALAELRPELMKLERDYNLVFKTIGQAQSSISARLKDGKRAWRLDNPDAPEEEFKTSPLCMRIQNEVALPKLTSPVIGVNLTHKSKSFLPEDQWARLLEFLERHPVDPFWYAPQDAIKDGKVQPLSQEARSWLIRNLNNPKMKVSSFDKSAKEKVAWRWLIISHNTKYPLSRVALDRKLAVSYERKTKRPAAAPGKTADISATLNTLLGAIDNFKVTKPQTTQGKVLVSEDSMQSFLVNTNKLLTWLSAGYATYSHEDGFMAKPGKSGFDLNISRLNGWVKLSDSFSQGKELPIDLPVDVSPLQEAVNMTKSHLSDLPVEDETGKEQDWDTVSQDEDPPESFDDAEGRTWFREDIDLIDIYDGQVYLVCEKYGATYRAISGVVPTSSSIPKSEKAKGKIPLRPASPPVIKQGEKSDKGGGSEKRKSPLEEDNPLRVKGEAKSKSLSDSQRDSLRKFFKLTEGLIPPEEWSVMDNKQKAAAMKERSIPRWATSAVLKRSSNLQLILEGKLTQNNVADALSSQPSQGSKGKSQALEAWVKLKSDFEGVTLCRRPTTGKEKSFKKRYDQLVADYGAQKCFPKPKEKPEQQGRAPSGRGNTRGGEMDGLLQLATAFGQIAKAFKS